MRLGRVVVAACVSVAVLGASSAQAQEEIKAKDVHRDAVVRYQRWLLEGTTANPSGLVPAECEVRGRNTFLPTSNTHNPAPVRDDCTTVAGKGFFSSVATCIVFEGAEFPRSRLREETRDCLVDEPGLREFSATVDGQEVELPRDRSFLITRPFEVHLSEQDERAVVAGGWWFRIHPLPVGEHEIRLRAVFNDGFTNDVVTHVTVVPG